MKKLLSCILVAVMLLSIMPTVFGADNEGLADAITTAKEKILIPDTYSDFESAISTDDFGNTLYHLSWRGESAWGDTDHISLEINHRGDLLSYRNSAAGDDKGEMRFAVYSGEEMKTLAVNWLTKVNPDWMAELPDENISAPAYGDPRYHTDSVHFERVVNGLPYCGDSVRVSVNNLTGEIVSMSANWTYETPSYNPDAALRQEQAKELFFSQSPMELAYQSRGEGEAIPVYSPKNAYLQINARDGKPFEEYNAYRYMAGGSNSAVMEESALDTAEKFSPSELKNLEEIEGLLDEKTLKESAQSLKYTGLDQAEFLALSYEGYQEEKNGETQTFYNARLSYLTSGEKEIRHTVLFDAQTGELLSYTSYPSRWDETKATVKAETARQSAEDFLTTYAQEKMEQSQEEPLEDDGISDYSFSYIRYANGLPFAEHRLSVTVDKHTGRIQRFFQHWDDTTVFASAEGLIDATEAEEKLMEQAGMVLSYAKAQNGESKIPVIDLMYTLNHEYPHNMDAKSGALLGYDNKVYTAENGTLTYPDDIQGHYAETPILTLIGSGILEGTEAFHPDAPITQKEMLAFVCGLHMGYIPYGMEFDSLVKTANRYGVSAISHTPDATITREKAVEMIVCALGYREVAELSHIYTIAFSDGTAVTDSKAGYLALAQGLKIIHGNGDGSFEPQNNLTRADAAMMIYNYLSR